MGIHTRGIECHTNATIHHTREQHSTMDETQTETQTTSTLLSQAADQEPNPRSTKKKTNSKTSKHLSHVMIITLPIPATIVVVICEPRGLSNPITMGIKTSKA